MAATTCSGLISGQEHGGHDLFFGGIAVYDGCDGRQGWVGLESEERWIYAVIWLRNEGHFGGHVKNDR